MTRRKGKTVPCAICSAPVYVPPCYSSGPKQRKYCSRDCMRVKQGGSADVVEAFWLKVDKTGPGGCWLYTGFKKWDGYGWLARKHNGRIRYMTAHRYAWILTHGDPAKGLSIMHLCDVPACCNPAHLKLGTHADNMADMAAKGRSGNKEKANVLWPDRVRPTRRAA